MKINRLIYALLLAAPLSFTSCDDDDTVIVESPAAEGTVTDDQGNTYKWVRIGNLDWTTSNALNGPLCTDDTYEGNWGPEYVFDPRYPDNIAYMIDEYIPQYGNLMRYEHAVASAPDGWRLPSDEDWKALERALGMTDADNLGWRGDGVAARLTETETGTRLGFQYGGGILRRQSYGSLEKEFQSLKEYGYFWTSTMATEYTDEPMAYFRKIVYGVSGVERRPSNAENLFSVRWCRDASSAE